MPKKKPAAQRTNYPAAPLPATPTHIEINDKFRQALDLMENTSRHVFITGRAGTGKSTLLEYFRDTTKKQIAVLAPTGVAALNVRGQTIHSFCRFKPDITLEKVKKLSKSSYRPPRGGAAAYSSGSPDIYKRFDTIVIDEISMVRADLLDCVEKFLRLNGPKPKHPFGGLQMVFIGDLYQLPPVVTSSERGLFSGSHYETPYFFSSRIFQDLTFAMEFVELEKIYRQTEEDFIGLLNAIRNRSATDLDLDRLNFRYDPDFVPPDDEFYITLTTTNDLAFERNREKLSRLGGRAYSYDGFIEGDFERSSLPTDERLEVKVGAQVMLLNNDSQGRWVNGSIGRVAKIVQEKGEEDIIQVELQNGLTVEVGPNVWELFRFGLDPDTQQIVSEPVGAFTQYPLKLAWAITIHKSQGKTFDRVVIDFGRGTFAHGQAYVALSRCTNFQGLVLKKPIRLGHIRMDWNIVRFLTRFQYKKADELLSYAQKKALINEAISEGRNLEILYLKPDDTKTRRRVRPESIEMLEYNGKRFEGVVAYCYKREDQRHFRIDRMLEVTIL